MFGKLVGLLKPHENYNYNPHALTFVKQSHFTVAEFIQLNILEGIPLNSSFDANTNIGNQLSTSWSLYKLFYNPLAKLQDIFNF